MRIHKMTATFGALERKTLELEPGLNVIEAANESGKSTWCAFIRAMLYGIRTSERAKSGSTPDKVKYLPWSGAAMEGTMTVERGGTLYELTRLPKQGLLGDCEAVYGGSAERAPEMCGKSPGDVLIGASEDVFRKSAFISRPSLRVESSGELEKRISELVSSGEENYSFEEADDRLSKLRKRIKNARGGGALAEAEKEAARLATELSDIEEASKTTVKAESEREGLINAAARMESYIAAKERWDKKMGVRRLAAAKVMESAKAEALEAAKAALTKDGREITEGAVALARDAENAVARCERAAAEAKKTASILPPPDESKKGAPIFGYIAAGLGLLMAVIAIVVSNIPLGAAALILLAGGILVAVSGRKRFAEKTAAEKQAAAEAESATAAAALALVTAVKRRDELLAALGCTPDEAENLLRAVQSAEREYASAARTAATLDYLACDDPDIENAQEPTDPPANRELLQRTRERVEELGLLIARLAGERSHLGDPVVIATKLEAARERVKELREAEEIVVMAQAALSEASWEMQSRFAPIVGARAAELFSRMTGGRYAGVSFDRGMAFKTRLTDEAVSRDAAFLSEGAADQMYLAVRLAICQLVLGGDQPCPIILDDALACFDDARAAEAMALLRELSKERQIILFTCRSRDARLAKEAQV